MRKNILLLTVCIIGLAGCGKSEEIRNFNIKYVEKEVAFEITEDIKGSVRVGVINLGAVGSPEKMPDTIILFDKDGKGYYYYFHRIK